MKIMIMIRKIFLCLVIDMEQSKIFFQISGFLGLIKLIGQQHLRFLLSEG